MILKQAGTELANAWALSCQWVTIRLYSKTESTLCVYKGQKKTWYGNDISPLPPSLIDLLLFLLIMMLIIKH